MLDISGADRVDHRQLADRVLRDGLLEVVQQLHARPRLLPRRQFFVVSTTGAYGGAGLACDSTARFETNATGSGIKPSWVNNTGGDTTYAVEITNSVVYTGGHARWQNNPFAADSAGPGCRLRAPASRPSTRSTACRSPGTPPVTAASASSTSWSTTSGLWVASDTTRIGANYLRSRIALLPVGGTTFPGVPHPVAAQRRLQRQDQHRRDPEALLQRQRVRRGPDGADGRA